MLAMLASASRAETLAVMSELGGMPNPAEFQWYEPVPLTHQLVTGPGAMFMLDLFPLPTVHFSVPASLSIGGFFCQRAGRFVRRQCDPAIVERLVCVD